jgi:hypothetical protein
LNAVAKDPALASAVLSQQQVGHHSMSRLLRTN